MKATIQSTAEIQTKATVPARIPHLQYPILQCPILQCLILQRLILQCPILQCPVRLTRGMTSRS